MEAITSSAPDGGNRISIAGATTSGRNHRTVHHSLTSIRIGCVEFRMCYPTDNLKQEIEKLVILAKSELVFCVSKSDIFHCLVSCLRKNPDVIRLVRDYLSTVPMIVQQPGPKDIKLGLGGGNVCEILKRLCDPIVHGDKDMSVGNNATIAANDLVLDALANGIKILVSTPGGGFVEETTEGSVKRLAKQLKFLQYNETNRIEINEAQNEKNRAKRKTQVEQEAVQLRTLVQEAIKNEALLDMTLQDFILSLVHEGKTDAGPLLKQHFPVVHLTGKDPFKQKEWYWKDGLSPMLASNSTLSISSNYLEAKHDVRNLDDTGNWGSVSLVRALHHMITHHGYEAKDGAVFHLLMFTLANQHYPAWHQFKVTNRAGAESIFPACALYSRCFVDPEPCLIVKLELTSNIVNKNTQMTVKWMNGKEVNINAKDKGFEITINKAISHPDAPLDL